MSATPTKRRGAASGTTSKLHTRRSSGTAPVGRRSTTKKLAGWSLLDVRQRGRWPSTSRMRRRASRTATTTRISKTRAPRARRRRCPGARPPAREQSPCQVLVPVYEARQHGDVSEVLDRYVPRVHAWRDDLVDVGPVEDDIDGTEEVPYAAEPVQRRTARSSAQRSGPAGRRRPQEVGAGGWRAGFVVVVGSIPRRASWPRREASVTSLRTRRVYCGAWKPREFSETT